MDQTKTRCSWCEKDNLYMRYHDEEWGVPEYDDQKLFEKLILEGFQSGLSWYTILRKRAHFRKVFDGFDALKMAAWDEQKLLSLLADPGIIRNRKKIEAARHNAQVYLDIQKAFGAFSRYIWSFTEHRILINYPETMADLAVSSPESDRMASDLKARGFKFVGSTSCYAFMQSMGMVDDHLMSCWRKA